MVKLSNARVNFNPKLLKKLTQKENSGVEVHTTVQHLAIYPHQLNNFNDSVKGLLNAKIAKYNKTFNGILLGYKNIKLLKDGGVIQDDSYYIHFDLQADFYIFKPEIGKIMEGVVKRKSKDHIGALVYEAFNVSIPLTSDDDEEELGNTVKVGDTVTFQIIYINLTSRLPYIRGRLMSETTETETNEISEIKIKKRKKKSKTETTETETNETTETKVKKKKSKTKEKKVEEMEDD
ncbi:DNA-directed RNA polymerase I subunit RPA43 [Diabrotica virgifera virgifera]|uniref:DNA-directed RNA polymerase I subunit RPA43 n=2 Tax=Diabrotica virgifera virgifera TaxID=50390 RepID=A0ABM5KHM9_DIAVI|nr:DNA-directed RNA polymerase I subunit RPA43 [Diabrotica virgifera virgifera]